MFRMTRLFLDMGEFVVERGFRWHPFNKASLPIPLTSFDLSVVLSSSTPDVFQFLSELHARVRRYSCMPVVSCQRHKVVPSSDRKKLLMESLWREFFSDPSMWWDHRAEKVNPRYPDFKHKKTGQSLWFKDTRNPSWVEEKLAAMAPGSVQENIFSWNKRLERCCKAGDYEETIELFEQMQREGLDPNNFTFNHVLHACSKLGLLQHGERIHEQIIRTGHESDLYVSSCLVDMYTKCGRIENARRVFDRMPSRDVVVWTAMIQGYVKFGGGEEALELFQRMQEEGVHPDTVTFIGVLNACASVAALEEGRLIHERIILERYESDVYVSSCLVDMYAKCGSIDDARTVFDRMPTRNVVSWNAMIQGYVKCGDGQEALELFRRMQQEGVHPDPVTFVGVLNACASIAALDEGRHTHEKIIERGYEYVGNVGNSLVDMYAKCGSIDDARRVFNKMPTRNVVAWNAMIAGCGMHGCAREAIQHFKLMTDAVDVDVDAVTFISLLSACNHEGLVDEGVFYFKSMSAVYKIQPMVEHYACVVDLLGRAGRLHEAEELISSMPFEPDACVWMSLLGAGKAYRDVPTGELAAERVLELEPEDSAAYVLLSDIYASVRMCNSKARLDRERLVNLVNKYQSAIGVR